MPSFPRNSIYQGKTNSPDTPKLNPLEENIGAVSIDLTPADPTQIETAAANITPEGAATPKPSKR